MNSKLWRGLAAVCIFTLVAGLAVPVLAQEVKEKAPMYCYVGLWAIPRAQWADMAKADEADQAILQKAIAGGTLVSYGSDVNLVHQPKGPTHDDWWCAMSMAGILNVLDQFYKSGNSTSPVLASATSHWDEILVSRYYNWHPGTYKDVYVHGASYKLKADAPDDALDTLAKSAIVPMMEKMLASGAIHEYEIDTEAIHTEAPGTFYLFYVAANADGLDKMNAALRDTLKANPLIGPAFDSAVDFSAHRDFLDFSTATFK